MKSSAIISECGLYRYLLSRSWDADLPSMTFVMLNPSTADADSDDPTIRKCVGFAKKNGCGEIHVVNLFAFRATKPTDMEVASDPKGPMNAGYLEMMLTDDETTLVAAWGNHMMAQRPGRVLASVFPRMMCLGKNKNGSPKHPLFVPYDQELIAF